MVVAQSCYGQKWSRGQVEARFANMSPCLIGMEACVGAHHLSRKLKMLGHDARLMRRGTCAPIPQGMKNDFRDAEAATNFIVGLKKRKKPDGTPDAVRASRAYPARWR